MLVSQIRAVLAGSGLPAQRLVLEITESMLVADPEDTREILREIQRLGVTIAIDDFGTGYSSLGRLHRFPVDTVKIDKLFIDQIEGPDGEGRTFVEAILRLAREMHLSTIAEGIESESQLRALSDMGCDSGQGFLLSRPLGARTVRPFIEHATANAPAVPAG
jgi:EAL domain-containing protein (putative c-di-GMP-specific phosphodiesterase class I)